MEKKTKNKTTTDQLHIEFQDKQIGNIAVFNRYAAERDRKIEEETRRRVINRVRHLYEKKD